MSPHPTPHASISPDPTRNLAVLVAGALFCTCLWWWFDFSGPFRWLVDLELRLFGNYWEPSVAVVLGVGAAALAWVAVMALRRLLPDVSAATVNALVATVFVTLSFAVLAKAWALWNGAAHMPSLDDPVQVVALDRLAGAAPPTGHVRLLGTPAHHRTVTLRFHYRTTRHVEAYAPMTDGRSGLEPGALRLLVTSRGPDESAAVNKVPADPEGVLRADGIDTRTVYELRRRGLPVADRHYVLFWPGEGVNADAYIEAALLALPVLLFWPLAAWDAWRRRRAGVSPTSAAVPAVLPAVADTPPPAAPPIQTPTTDGIDPPDGGWRLRDVSLSGVAAGAAVLAFMALWQWGWMLPDPYALWGFAAAGGLFLLSVAIETLGTGGAPSAMTAGEPPADAAWLHVMRDAPVSGPSYFRVDVDGVRIAVLKANQCTAVALSPGAHALAINGRVSLAGDTVARFDVVPGEVVVYQLQVPFFGRPRLERRVDVEGARKTMARLKKIEPAVAMLSRRHA